MDRFEKMDNYEKNGLSVGAAWGLYSGLWYILRHYTSPPIYDTSEQYVLALTTNVNALERFPALLTDYLLFHILWPSIEYIVITVTSILQSILEHIASQPVDISTLPPFLLLKAIIEIKIFYIIAVVILLLIPLILCMSIGSLISISLAILIRNLRNRIVH